MTQSLDLPGILLSSDGDRFPCRLVDINEKGYLVINAMDPILVHGRYQLLISNPRMTTVIRVTASELVGEIHCLEVVCEDDVADLRWKLIEQKVRGFIK